MLYTIAFLYIQHVCSNDMFNITLYQRVLDAWNEMYMYVRVCVCVCVYM